MTSTARRPKRKARSKKKTKPAVKAKRPSPRAQAKSKRSTRTKRKARSVFRGMDDPKRARMMIEILSAEYPDAHCMLEFSNPFELLTATILAAQCTDVMVNRVTATLFKKYPGPQAFVDAPAEEIEQAIFKTGFYRNKTKSIQKCCRSLLEDHDGKVPSTMEELLALGGVGRKTANCVLGNAFGIPGIVVDTHVKRLSNRMGFTVESNPDKIEMDLNRIVPREEWTHFSHLLADHGRTCCTARNPRCDECPVEHLCPKMLD